MNLEPSGGKAAFLQVSPLGTPNPPLGSFPLHRHIGGVLRGRILRGVEKVLVNVIDLLLKIRSAGLTEKSSPNELHF